MTKLLGTIKKMHSKLDTKVQYQLPVGENKLDLNNKIGQRISLFYTGNIFCSACGKKTKKSYAQGHCYVCMSKLASCDLCIMKPETCHYEQGTCREPSWGEANCMIPHYVYLSNTSGLKVGITRHNQIPTRWIDQGATQALPIFKVKTRHISGLLEVALAKLVNDKTNWRAMLKGNNEKLDLKAQAQELIQAIEPELKALKTQFGEEAIEQLNNDVLEIHYPVEQFPTKINSHNFDKNPVVEGVLQGIKGQYLLLDTGVINIRKFGSYEIETQAD